MNGENSMADQSYFLHHLGNPYIHSNSTSLLNTLNSVRVFPKHLPTNVNRQIYLPPIFIRFLHATQSLKGVDVYLNGKKILYNFSFKEISQYITLPVGIYLIEIYPQGSTSTPIIRKEVKLKENNHYTLPLISKDKTYQLLEYIDDNKIQSPITNIRVINLSPFYKNIDVSIKNGNTLFSTIGFKEATPYLTLTPMTVDLEIKDSLTKETIREITNTTFKPNLHYSIVLLNHSVIIY
ncbi:DUF4397 domain-containing protein [Heyndrickxia oleronia]